MRTEILVINQRTDIFSKCIPRQQAWDDALSIFLPGGDWLLKGGKSKFEGKK